MRVEPAAAYGVILFTQPPARTEGLASHARRLWDQRVAVVAVTVRVAAREIVKNQIKTLLSTYFQLTFDLRRLNTTANLNTAAWRGPGGAAPALAGSAAGLAAAGSESGRRG